jgi:fatty-acyl-CoA synthase
MKQPMKLPQVFNQIVEKHPDQLAIISENERYTYAQLKDEVIRTASSLIAQGLRPGDRIAIWMSNRPEYLIIALAAVYIGIVLVPLNTRYKPKEASEILVQSEARALFMMDRFLNIDYVQYVKEMIPGIDHSTPGFVYSANLPDLRLIVTLNTTNESSLPSSMMEWVTFRNMGKMDDSMWIENLADLVSDSDIFILQFTSGTTGKPKGAILEHRQLINTAYKHLENWQLMPGESLLIPNPYSHIMGLVFGCLLPLVSAASTICLETFDVKKTLWLLEKYDVVGMAGTPTMYNMLLNDPLFHNSKFKSLRVGIIAGAASSPTLVKDIKEKFALEGLISGLGMTEAAGSVSATRITDPIEKVIHTVGKPTEGYEVKVVDVKTRKELPVGEKGELAIRGSSIMRGYYKMPEETAKVFDKDGWFYTGDLVSIDKEGYLRFEGRQKEMFTVGGFNVYPKEVENVLKSFPNINEAQVVGVPDVRLGEVGMAFLKGTEIEEKEIIEFCRKQLANYKVPRYFKWVDSFPMTSSGKIKKTELEEKAREIIN